MLLMDKTNIEKNIGAEENRFFPLQHDVQYFEVIQKWFSPTSEYDALKVTYTTSVEFIGTLKNKNVVFKIDRKKLLLNGQLPEENIVTALAEKCGAVIYPLEISVDVAKSYTFIVHNYLEILKRWQALKPALHEYYDGEELFDYINDTNVLYNDEAMLTERINLDLMLNVYFKGIFNNNNKEEQILFSLNKLIKNEPNKMIASITGIVDKQKMEDLNALEDVESDAFITDGSVEVFYEYNTTANKLDNIDGAWSVFVDGIENNISINIAASINVEFINN
jgi:hypothetical protein